MNWLSLLPDIISRIPFERLVSRQPDNKERLKELKEILEQPEINKTESEVQEIPTQRVHLEYRQGDISTEETVDYQNREIGKLLLRMEGHCTQKFRLYGKICDCGAQKHLLDLESLCEETVPMVDNPGIYYEIIDLGKELAPKCLPEVVATLKYDDEFPRYARRYRDLRKKLIGNLDVTEIEKPEPGKYYSEEVVAND
jgi:hypothetical protein